MNTQISIELDAQQLARLQQAARAMDQVPEATATALVEEGLRLREFPGIHFRDTGAGRRAFVPGLRLPIYFLAELAREVNDAILYTIRGASSESLANTVIYAQRQR